MLGNNSRLFNPAAVPKVMPPFPGTAAAQMPALLRLFSRRPAMILPARSFVLHVVKHRAWSAFAVAAGGHFCQRIPVTREGFGASPGYRSASGQQAGQYYR
jgi:hypothetical protein